MKRVGKFILIFFVFAATLLTLPATAQNEPTGMGMRAPGVVAKPSFETVDGGFNLKVWIMSAVSDGSLADTNGVDNTGTGTDEGEHATHHVMVEVKDAVEGKEISDANVRIEILSPTGKTDIVDLEKMMNQYGGNIPLDEKGEYKLSVFVSTDDGRSIKKPFSYKVSK